LGGSQNQRLTGLEPENGTDSGKIHVFLDFMLFFAFLFGIGVLDEVAKT
jgi:hypothetical protein